jgi:site-specific DNA recombinase
VADYLDQVVWGHVTGILADPQLIRAEIDKRLEAARTADPVARQRKSLDTELVKAGAAITRMIESFGEQLITIDELRARMPDLRARETNLRNQIDALDAQLADRQAYLTLAADLEGFLAQLHAKAEVSTIAERQRVLRLLVKDVLIGADKITIRHRIPLRQRTTSDRPDADNTDTEGEHPKHCPLRWGRGLPDPQQHLPGQARHVRRAGTDPAVLARSTARRQSRLPAGGRPAQEGTATRLPHRGPPPGEADAHAPLHRPDGPRLPPPPVGTLTYAELGLCRLPGYAAWSGGGARERHAGWVVLGII